MLSVEKLTELAQLGAFALVGGVAKQCQVLLRGTETFTAVRFLLQMGLAVFAGMVAGSFMPPDMAYRDGFILLIGFTAQPILDIIEFKFLAKFKELP
jgi:hypothetical protein